VDDALSTEAGQAELIAECHRRCVALLLENQGPQGILAAREGERSRERGYTAVFGRDAAICAIGMALSGNPELAAMAGTGLATLARFQADNGQMPKFVDTGRDEADFWYLGCIDSTLWWLIAVDFLDRQRGDDDGRRRYAAQIAGALAWLRAQEHQRFFLLQQNEASDWADIMPRSGFVLYTNALWYHVKRLYGLSGADLTLLNFNQLFFPFSGDPSEYRRARLLAQYATDQARHRDLYLSFVNLSFFGEEGDVFGNLLAVLLGLADEAAVKRTLDALAAQRVNAPYPVRVVCEPIVEHSFLWRPYMSRHQQNFAWQYHNGGIWPFVGGFWVTALAAGGDRACATRDLAALAQANALDGWGFNEWLHGQTMAPSGMPGQSWNAAAFLMAEHALRTGIAPFAVLPRQS
jgi:Alkaline and neutral invertase